MLWELLMGLGIVCNFIVATAILVMLFATITHAHAWPVVAVGAILFFAVLFWVRLAYENR